MDVDWGSFILGGVAVGVASFVKGLLGRAGADAWPKIKGLVYPEPKKVGPKFVPVRWVPGDCAWVNALNVDEHLADGYVHYKERDRGPTLYREVPDRGQAVREYLMVQPGKKPI